MSKQSTPTHKQKTYSYSILVLACFSILSYSFFTAYLNLTKQSASEQLLSTPSTQDLPNVHATATNTTNWKEYKNSTFGFSVKYPDNLESPPEPWEHYEYDSPNIYIGFGPKSSRSGGYVWGITVHPYSTITDLTQQLPAENKQYITINGVPALLTTSTFNTGSEWLTSQTVFIEKNGVVFDMSDGSLALPEFKAFYESFRFIDKK